MLDVLRLGDLAQPDVGFLHDVLDLVRGDDPGDDAGDPHPHRKKEVANLAHPTPSESPSDPL